MGTKLDIATMHPEKRQVSLEEAHSMVSSHRMIGVTETSAKQDMNIERAFTNLARVLRKKHEGTLSMAMSEKCTESISLHHQNGLMSGKESECWPSC